MLKLTQDQTYEKIEDEEFMNINISKNKQDTGQNVLDIVHYDKHLIHMLRYIEESKEWKGLFKRKRKPAKRRRIVLIDEDETKEYERIIVHEEWLIAIFSEEYIKNMKEESLNKEDKVFY